MDHGRGYGSSSDPRAVDQMVSRACFPNLLANCHLRRIDGKVGWLVAFFARMGGRDILQDIQKGRS